MRRFKLLLSIGKENFQCRGGDGKRGKLKVRHCNYAQPSPAVVLNPLLHATRLTKREREINPGKIKGNHTGQDHHHHRLYEMTRCWLREPARTANPRSLGLPCTTPITALFPFPFPAPPPLPTPRAGQQGSRAGEHLGVAWSHVVKSPKALTLQAALRRTHE